MGYKRLKCSVVLFFGLGLSGLQAQEAISATGGDTRGGGCSVSYSVGQVVYQFQPGTNGWVTEGVQQPYEISLVTGMRDVKVINLKVSVYPNPTTDVLQLKVGSEQFEGLSYQLFNIQGKLLQSAVITKNETSIFMNNLVPAIYFLKVLRSNKGIKVFKIIKN